MAKKNNRADHSGSHRRMFERNKKYILATQDVCGICGKPVDKTLKYPDPWCATIDHIIPCNAGGHPSALDNLQLAHFRCNRKKSDSLSVASVKNRTSGTEVIPNNVLPQVVDWTK